jgi:signal transduction histidine kinase
VEQVPSKILVVDDEPTNIVLLSRYLQNDEFTFITAVNGVDALEKTRSEMPDLLLLDLNMPAMDGFDVLREIRQDSNVAHIPVIILTAARSDPMMIQHSLNLGADDFVSKPFDRRDLLARIRAKLRVKKAEDVIRRRNKEWSLLPEIGKDLSARLDIDELAEVVLHRAVEMLGAMFGYISIFNSDVSFHKEYCATLAATSRFEAPLSGLENLLEQIKETRQGLIINDTNHDFLWKALPGAPTRSAVVVPMFGRFKLIGLLVLMHEKVGYFNLEQQLLLQAIASQAAIAVENAQLYASQAQEQHRMTAVLESVADAILLFDADARLLLLNPAGEKLFAQSGAKPGQPLSRGCGHDALIELIEETCAARKPLHGEITWPDQRVFAAQFAPIGEGGCVVNLHDVSYFKTLQRIKDEFISTASHDLKNPITSVLGYGEMLAKAGPLNEMQTDFANRIHTAAEYMRQLVSDLLDLKKMDLETAPEKETVDLNHLISNITDEFRFQSEAKKQIFQFDEAENQPELQGNRLQLQQALRNLVGNAIKYTPVGGSISLDIKTSNDTAVICIKDTGYGIPEDELPFIFESFYRVRTGEIANIEGSGLGLAIVKSVVERHGGEIHAESKLGQGSCFTLTLPLS